MTAGSTAARGQLAALRWMTDACRVFRRGQATYNPATGLDEHTETTIYAGKCRVRPAGRDRLPRFVESSGSPLGVWFVQVSIPLTVTGIDFGDLVSITASIDPGLVGSLVRIQGIDAGTHVTARRLTCGHESR